MTLSGKLKNVPGSTPTSPSYTSPKPFHMTEKKERKRTSVSVDLPRDHKSNSHILEATLLSGEKPRIKRSTTPPAYFREFSDDYLPDRIYEYDWNLSNEVSILNLKTSSPFLRSMSSIGVTNLPYLLLFTKCLIHRKLYDQQRRQFSFKTNSVSFRWGCICKLKYR